MHESARGSRPLSHCACLLTSSGSDATPPCPSYLPQHLENLQAEASQAKTALEAERKKAEEALGAAEQVRGREHSREQGNKGAALVRMPGTGAPIYPLY